MGMMFKLALRNVFRNRRRSLITFSAVMIGILAFIVLEGMTEALQNMSVRLLKKVETAHLKVFARGYWDDRIKEPLKHRITDYTRISELIRSKKDIEGVTGRINFQVQLYKGRNEMPCMGTAVDINNGDKSVFALQDSLVKGKFLTDGENVLLGTTLADLFDAKPGSWITFEFKDKNGVYDAIQAQVSGIVETGHPDIDQNVVFLPLSLAQERLDMKNEVTEIAILLKSESKMEKFKSEILKELNNLPGSSQRFEVLTWKEQAADFIAFMKADAEGGYIIVYILVVIIIAGIMNTMLMAVFERVREIGTMMALGMTKAKIRRMFLLEGAIIGGIGAFAGMLIGLIIMIQFSAHGINMASLYGDLSTIYPVKDYIYGSVRFGPFLIAFLIGVGVALLASYLPARSAAKLKPVEALRRY
jgi:putative ABC transport system permease protein